MPIKFLRFSVLLLLAGSRVFGQSADIVNDPFNVRNFREEIYVQTDRDIYFTGEQVWMKIFKLDRLNSLPVNESKVVYLELLDYSGNIVKQAKAGSDEFSSQAYMRLPDTLSTGNFVLRAYSTWMENASENLFFYKYISVINPFRNIERLIYNGASRITDSVKVFPEGSALISGIATRAGVRSVDFNGRPVKTSGLIVSATGEVITPFSTDSLGFGSVTFVPKKDQKLFAQFKTPGGTVKKQPLPLVLDSGLSLSADADANSSAFRIKIMRTGALKSLKRGRVEVLSSGLLTVRKELFFDYDSIVTLPFTSLPQGSLQLIVSDEYGKRLSERWIYNGAHNSFGIKIDLPKKEFGTRQNVTFDVSALTDASSPLSADLSVSVVKKCLSVNDRVNLAGRNEYATVPGEWFSGLSLSDLNSRLLAFKAHNWGENGVAANAIPLFLPELGGQLVSGTIRSKSNHEPIANLDISLSFVGKTARCQFEKTDSAGAFNFVVNKPGLSEIVIQPMKPLATGYYVEFDQPFCTTFSDHMPPPFNLDSTATEEINKAVISMQVNNIYESFRPKQDNGSSGRQGNDFYGKPDKTINLADYIELTTIKEVLKEIVPDIMVVKRNKEYLFKLVNLPYSSNELNPLVLVDGVPYYNISKLLDINSNQLERIDILNSKYYYTDYVFDGIVSFITKKGNMSAMEYDNTVFRQVFEGCQAPIEFVSPDYSADQAGLKRIPDFRNTLYWKPDLKSDRAGRSKVSFFTSDEPGEYIVTVEGITPDGKTGLASVVFTVK
jgi:hypothetical protein